jgi:F-type H+-transporting ATPase subunit b
MRGDLEGAQSARTDAEQLKADFEHKIAEAHADARKLLDEARADADQLRARLKADTETELANLRQRAADDINRAKQQALQDLYATSAELATAVAGKILQRQVTDADTQQLVEQSLAELDQLKAG